MGVEGVSQLASILGRPSTDHFARYIDHLEKQERDLSNRAPSVSQANGSDHHVSPVLASPDNINTHRSVGSSTTISRGAGMR